MHSPLIGAVNAYKFYDADPTVKGAILFDTYVSANRSMIAYFYKGSDKCKFDLNDTGCKILAFLRGVEKDPFKDQVVAGLSEINDKPGAINTQMAHLSKDVTNIIKTLNKVNANVEDLIGVSTAIKILNDVKHITSVGIYCAATVYGVGVHLNNRPYVDLTAEGQLLKLYIKRRIENKASDGVARPVN